MMDKLDKPGQFTLFAPTNKAFDKLAPGYLQRMMEDKDVIAGMLYMQYFLDSNGIHPLIDSGVWRL